MIDIRKAARDASIMVVLGSSERDGGSLYMAQTFIAADGSIDLHRRKFKPTAHERIIFGDAVSLISMQYFFERLAARVAELETKRPL